MTPATMAAVTPKPDRFRVALENITKVRPRVEVDTWTEEDAAKFWWPQWDEDPNNMMPADLVLGVVARLFGVYSRHFAPMRKFWHLLPAESAVLYPQQFSSGLKEQARLTWNNVCYTIYEAYKTHDSDGFISGITRNEYVLEGGRTYCDRKTCRHQSSFLGGCVPEYYFDPLFDAGLLVPWGSVKSAGLTVLFPSLRHSTVSPYLSVRRERSHIKRYAVPYYVAQRIELWHRIIPAILSKPEVIDKIRSEIRPFTDALSSERLRFHAVAAMSGDSTSAMQFWDEAFTTTVWMFGQRDGEVYESFSSDFWQVDGKTLEDLQKTEPVDLFPEIPDSKEDA